MRRMLSLCFLVALMLTSCRPVVKEYRDLRNRTYADGRQTSEDGSLQWPGGQKAAVCLTYDDGLDCHLDMVVPDLEKYGLRGSFFITGNASSLGTRLEEWREAADLGHELGNHSLYHACSRIQEFPPERSGELMVMNTLLRAIDGRTERTFAYPCIAEEPEGWTEKDYFNDLFIAARMTGPIPGTLEKIDLFGIPSWNVNEAGISELIRYAEEAAENGTIAVFAFHAVEGDDQSLSRQAHEELLKYLDEHRDVYWTDTFINISKYLNENLNR